MKYIFALLLIAFIVGCSTSQGQVDRIVGSGQPKAYKDGYKDGCDSGYVQAGHPYYRFSKNVTRYSRDDLYKQGWDDGSTACRTSYSNIGRY